MHYLLCLLFILTTSLNALIVETGSFKEITSYTNEETLVLLDIDDTLLLPVQMLGSDEWFLRHMQDIENKGLTKPLALERCLADWEAVRHITKMKVVETGTEQIVSKMQEEGVSVMALTTQGMALATRTVQQLADAGFNLLRTAPCADDFYIALAQHGVLYRKGVLFTSGTDKGAALFHFLDSIDYIPARIVFINDKASHLKEVENTAVKGVWNSLGFAMRLQIFIRQHLATILRNFSSHTQVLIGFCQMKRLRKNWPHSKCKAIFKDT